MTLLVGGIINMSDYPANQTVECVAKEDFAASPVYAAGEIFFNTCVSISPVRPIFTIKLLKTLSSSGN